jgi:hypothetical protein
MMVSSGRVDKYDILGKFMIKTGEKFYCGKDKECRN